MKIIVIFPIQMTTGIEYLEMINAPPRNRIILQEYLSS